MRHGRVRRAAACLGSPRCLTACGLVIAEDNYLVREGTRRLLRTPARSRSSRRSVDGEQLLDAVRRLRAGRRPHRHPDAAGPSHGGHRGGTRDPGPIDPRNRRAVLSQHSDESYAFALLQNGTAGLAYLLKDRHRRPGGPRPRALREVAQWRIRDRPGSCGRAGSRRRSAVPRSARSPGSRRANSTCCGRWPRARPTPASRRRCTCPPRRLRSTSTRSSRSSRSRRRRYIGGLRRCWRFCRTPRRRRGDPGPSSTSARWRAPFRIRQLKQGALELTVRRVNSLEESRAAATAADEVANTVRSPPTRSRGHSMRPDPGPGRHRPGARQRYGARSRRARRRPTAAGLCRCRVSCGAS